MKSNKHEVIPLLVRYHPNENLLQQWYYFESMCRSDSLLQGWLAWMFEFYFYRDALPVCLSLAIPKIFWTRNLVITFHSILKNFQASMNLSNVSSSIDGHPVHNK